MKRKRTSPQKNATQGQIENNEKQRNKRRESRGEVEEEEEEEPGEIVEGWVYVRE